MWAKRRGRNRRFQRAHVLDVKLSSVQRRRTRLRRALFLLGVVGSMLIGLLIVWRGGEWLLTQLLYRNPAFAIHRLDVQTDGVISLEQIRRWAGVRLEDNLLALNLARVKRDLELIPAIRAVAVERVLPHTLRVRVSERQPIAQVLLPQPRPAGLGPGLYTLDAEGYFMLPLEEQQRSLTAPTNKPLPLLAGIPATELRPGRRTELSQVHAALALIVAFERSAMAGRAELHQIELAGPNLLRASAGEQGEIIFGLDNPDAQLRRWRAVYEYGRRAGRQLAWIDLSVSNNLPTRWLDTEPVPVTPLKTPNPSVHKRKHA